MKRIIFNKPGWLTILSIGVLSIFVFMGGICWTDSTPKPERKLLPDGKMQEVKKLPKKKRTITTTGNWDKANSRFEGPVVILYQNEFYDNLGTIEVNMVEGKRHGQAIKTHFNPRKVEPLCYQHGKRVDDDFCEKGSEKSATIASSDNSAYSIFSYEEPLFEFELNMFDFDSDYVEAYLDTLELLLYASEFSEEDFADYYDEVIDVLEETAYDSIIQLNDILSFYNGIELILDNEFRLATIDSYRDGEGNTYQVIQSTYPNYLLQLNMAEVTDSDFEGFCSVYDSIMSTYVPLVLEDFSFIDSLDERMYRTLSLINGGDDSSESESQTLKSVRSTDKFISLRALQQDNFSQNSIQALDLSPQEVSDFVLLFIIVDFINGDLIKDAVQKAFTLKNGIVQLPTVVTDFSGNTSSTSVDLYGHVMDDGGGEVSSRGITWASFYNPTIDNQLVSAGSGIGEFEISLTELTEGETYYARSFATNSVGTAYGNCISFIAQNTTGIDPTDLSAPSYNIYPNPASDHINLTIKAKDSKAMVFTLYDLSGKVILQNEIASLVQGENMIRVDLSEIESGSYICRLKRDEDTSATQILLITR